MARGVKQQCPSCGKHSLWYTAHNDFAYCFSCGYKSKGGTGERKLSLPPPHIRELRAAYEAMLAATTMPDWVRAWLHRRGVSDTSIERFRIGYLPPEARCDHPYGAEAGIALRDGSYFLRGRVLFPYINRFGDVTDVRGRVIEPDFAFAPDRKYLSPYRSAVERWSFDPYNAAASRNQFVVVTEGELKAIASEQAGFPTVAFPGIRSYRNNLLIPAGARVVICFDYQQNHFDHVVAATVETAKRIERMTDDVRVAILPLTKDKVDIDGFILDHGADAYRRRIHAALPWREWARLVAL